MTAGAIEIRGARQNNLAGVDVDIPRNRLVVFTGVSGSGKSSLAFDTLFREGQRRFLETLSAYARQFLGRMEKPDVDRIDGLAPAIAVDQQAVQRGPRSTVGTVTEVVDHLRVLFARAGTAHCPEHGAPLASQTPEAVVRAFGINVPRMITLTYGFGVALAALAGVMAAPIYNVSPQMGANLIIVVFAVVVIGGMGSIMGAIVTGFGLGIIEGLTKVFFPEASNTVIFIIMAIVLLIRPAGLFGRGA